MNFQPKTTDEIDKEKREFATQSLLPKGWYDFEVMHAEDAKSKAGNDMIKLKLRVFGPNEREKHVYDYLLEAAPAHLFDFCDSVGLATAYHSGTLTASQCIGRAARVQLAIDDKDRNYEPKNVAKNYSAVKSSSAATDPADDEPPF